MPIRSLVSSNLDTVGYIAESCELLVVFKSGRHYIYSGVPLATYLRLVDAPSHGTFFNGEIKPTYPVGEVPEQDRVAVRDRFERDGRTHRIADLLKQYRKGVTPLGLFA